MQIPRVGLVATANDKQQSGRSASCLAGWRRAMQSAERVASKALDRPFDDSFSFMHYYVLYIHSFIHQSRALRISADEPAVFCPQDWLMERNSTLTDCPAEKIKVQTYRSGAARS